MQKLTLITMLHLSAFCASCTDAGHSALNTAPAHPENGMSENRLIYSVAASAKEVMETLAEEFQSQTKVEVKVNLGPSSGLASQILAGAPADLFLSASREWAAEVERAGHAAATVGLLTNRLVLVTPAHNRVGVKGPDDLLASSVQQVALAGENVPAGVYATQALSKLGLFERLVQVKKIVRAQDVRGALHFVERGEVEAGIVYATDAAAAPGVTVVYEFPPDLHEEIVYALVLLKHGSENTAARRFFEFLQSSPADETYKRFGFARP
jgi:molybdate transport system substrate-binding protein